MFIPEPANIRASRARPDSQRELEEIMRYYLDTEFDGFGGSLMSLALVREDGASRYLMTFHEAADPWVQANVTPILFDCPVDPIQADRRNLAMEAAAFLSEYQFPVIVTDWPADIRYFCELIEFPMGEMAPIAGLSFEMVRVDAYPTTLPGAVQHNAWWDAMALRHLLAGQKVSMVSDGALAPHADGEG